MARLDAQILSVEPHNLLSGFSARELHDGLDAAVMGILWQVGPHRSLPTEECLDPRDERHGLKRPGEVDTACVIDRVRLTNYAVS